MNLFHDFCLYELKSAAPITPLTINVNPTALNLRTAYIMGSGYQKPTDDAPVGPWSRQLGRVKMVKVETDGILTKASPSLPMFGDSGGALVIQNRQNKCLKIAGVLSTSLSAYCWAFSGGINRVGIFKFLDPETITEVGLPSTPSAKCLKPRGYQSQVGPDEVAFPARSAGAANLSSPEALRVLKAYAHDHEICGINKKCERICDLNENGHKIFDSHN